MLTGGPGTGKTTTVAGLLALLAEQAERDRRPPLRIALTAPTGKAAARLQQAVEDETADRLTDADRPGSAASVRPPCTGCSAGRRDRATGSVTTATTGCPTTWWSSTRPRWCR